MSAARMAAAVALLVAAFGAGWQVRDWQADADALEAAQQHAQVLAANAAETDRRVKEQAHAAETADKMRRAAAADAAAVRDVAGRLRDHAVALGAAACDPAAAADGPAGATASDLLADMLVRTSQAAGVLAAAADERQAALTECAARYDALTASGAAR